MRCEKVPELGTLKQLRVRKSDAIDGDAMPNYLTNEGDVASKRERTLHYITSTSIVTRNANSYQVNHATKEAGLSQTVVYSQYCTVYCTVIYNTVVLLRYDSRSTILSTREYQIYEQ